MDQFCGIRSTQPNNPVILQTVSILTGIFCLLSGPLWSLPVNASLLERIRQTNPWLFGGEPVGRSLPSRAPSPWIGRRQVVPGDFEPHGRAHLVVGPRQAGKSSICWSFLRGVARPLYLNMEEPQIREWCRSPTQFMNELHELGALDALFFEESQWLPNATLFIKGVVDQGPECPLLVTGSASFHLRARARESLAGRATRRTLLPLGLGEVVPGDGDMPPAVLELARRDAIERAVRIGGYPEVWNSRSPEKLLGHLLQAYVLRDASDLFQVERLEAYQKLLRLCARQVGDLVNQTELASAVGVAVGTVSRYLALMEEMHVVRLLPAFAGGKRREVTSARKVFFVDNGLRNAVLGRLSVPPEHAADRGKLFENWVFSELGKEVPWTLPIRYWRSLSGAEVDFVVDSPDSLLGVEVKAGELARPRLARSSRSFIEAYRPRHFWVLSQSFEGADSIDGTTVEWVPFHRLPERLCAWREEADVN